MVNLQAQNRLTNAIEKGDVEAATKAIAEGADVNHMTAKGENHPMNHLCAYSNRAGAPEIARLLLKHKSDPTVVDNYGNTALQAIVENSKSEHSLAVLRILVEEEKVPVFRSQEQNQARAKKWTLDCPALIIASRMGNFEAVKIVINATASQRAEGQRMTPFKHKDHCCDNAFETAIKENRAEIVDWILSEDASFLNDSSLIHSNFQHTPLSFAIKEKCRETTAVFLRHGASFTRRSGEQRDRDNAFETALKQGNRALVALMIASDHANKKVVLQKEKERKEKEAAEAAAAAAAAKSKDKKPEEVPQTPEQAKEKKLDDDKKEKLPELINYVGGGDKREMSPLFAAIEGGDLPIFLAVLEETEKAIVETIELWRIEDEAERKKKSLMQRAKEGITDAIKEKLEAEINKGAEGFSVHFETHKRRPLSIHTLCGYSDRNLLASAARGGHFEICRYLIDEKHFEVNALDSWGCPPIFQSLENGHYAATNLLIARGADVTVVKSGSKPTNVLHQAAEGGHLKTMLLAVDELERRLYAKYPRDDETVSRIMRELSNDTHGSFSRTPLLLAVRAFYTTKDHRLTICNLLLHLGASPLVTDTWSDKVEERETPIKYCKEREDLASELTLFQNHQAGQKYPIFDKREKLQVQPVPLFVEARKTGTDDSFAPLAITSLEEILKKEKDEAEAKKKLYDEERAKKRELRAAIERVKKEVDAKYAPSLGVSLVFWGGVIAGTMTLGFFLNKTLQQY